MTDPTRNAWRTFRADRMRLRSHAGQRFSRRRDPDGDLASYIERELGSAMWRYRARVRICASAEEVAVRVPPAVVVEAVEGGECFANGGSDSPHELALWLGLIDAEFDVRRYPRLAVEVRALAGRHLRAAGRAG
jgi:WYL domain